MKTTKKEKILEWLRERATKNNHVTNWHFGDDLLEFADNFYPGKNET